MIARPELTDPIIASFYRVHNELGHGFVESVYKNALAIDLSAAGFDVARELPIAVFFRGRKVGDFRADLLVEGSVIVEVKSGRAIEPAQEAQLLHYLRSTSVEIGLLLHFGAQPKFRRLVFDNARKTSLASPGGTRLVDPRPAPRSDPRPQV